MRFLEKYLPKLKKWNNKVKRELKEKIKTKCVAWLHFIAIKDFWKSNANQGDEATIEYLS